MGGKTWSFDEERFFWHEVIPQSPKGVNPVDRTMDWDACARRMQSEMGEKARRRYTKLMLCKFDLCLRLCVCADRKQSSTTSRMFLLVTCRHTLWHL